MKKRFFSCIGGGGNSRLASHIKGFNLIGLFNNLAPWGENKFVSELKRTYKFQRGVNNILDCHAIARNDVKRHTEDNSPKYRMVGEILSILRSFAVQTRIFAKECNIIAVGYVRSTAQDDENLNRLRNKCAMTCGLCPRPFGERFRGYLAASLLSRLAAFTLAEVLVTLGIIGVVAAMTLPTLIESHNRQVVETRLEKFYSTINQAIVRAEVDFGDRSDWYQDTNNIETDENGKPINGSSGVEKWWNTYLAPYVKTVGIDYDNGLPVFKFADGSCLKANQATAMRDWIYYTTSRDRCIKMAGSEENSRGVCSFSFMYVPTADSPYFYKKGFEPYKSGWNGTESGLYNACKKSDNKMDKSLCGALIQYNGWKIPKNYPLKVKY